jgi:ATP-binding cassette subfamily B protein
MLISFFEVLFVTIFYIILINRSISGFISVGGLIIYFQAFQKLQTAVNALFNSGITLFQNQLYLQEIMHYLSLPNDRNAEKSVDLPENAVIQKIQISNLNFGYPEKDTIVLSNINMHFLKGQFVAIVGENGSGKSTLLKLLCGLYKAKDGSLTFNGKNANDLPSSFFSNHISVVFQDYGKYYLSVEDNIAIGQEKPDRNKISLALEMATGGNLPSSLHSGIDTNLGRSQKLGEELSGGEWQKIAIARALYKECDILILDEPTSSIDPIAEVDFFQELRKANTENIVILITHRLYNLKMADNIYVLESGRIVESGTFSELIELKGFFSKYYNAQKI